MQELFESIRESCDSVIWSKAVLLSRAGAVAGERASQGEIVCRVQGSGEPMSRLVVLDLEGEDWSCDCKGRDDPCVHVAAAAIAVNHARKEGKDLPVAKISVASVAYRFLRSSAGLTIHRVLMQDGGEEPLRSTLSALTSGRIKGPPLTVSEADLAVDLILGTTREGWFPDSVLGPIFDKLDGVEVQLDGEPIRLSRERVGARGRLEDQGEGFRLSIRQDPSIAEVFANGVARCGDSLRIVTKPDLSARELDELRAGVRFGPDRLGELVGEVLPSLRRRIPVDIATRRLPEAERIPPRVILETEQEGETLSVLASIVYGEPIRARVVGDRIVGGSDALASFGAGAASGDARSQDDSSGGSEASGGGTPPSDPQDRRGPASGGPLPLRDRDAEDRLKGRLQRELGIEPGRRIALAGEEAVAFTGRLRTFDAQVVGPGVEAFSLTAPLVAELLAGGGGFGVNFQVGGEPGRMADPAAVLRAWQGGAQLVSLVGGGLAPLPLDWLERFGARVADLLAARDARGELPTAALPELARLCEELDLPPPPGFEALRPLVEDFQELPQPELPADLRADLRSYQQEGVAWLSFLKSAGLGALLADDMGLGKTLQAATVLGEGSLVVAPTSVLHNWRQELARFRPGLDVSVYHGPGRSLDRGADVVLTTYAILRLDAERLAARRWSTVVLDEAQAIKNPDSRIADAAFQLQADFRICLSGTPVENRLDELWSQLHFLNRGLLGGRKDFQERYAGPIGDGHPAVAARLRSRIKPFVLRRLKRDVAPELPPRTEVVIHCTLSEEERKVYDSVRAAAQTEVVERLSAGGSVLAALEALLRLRQAACHPALVPGQNADSSSKVELLLEQLDQAVADGHKALVFSQWTSLLDKVEPHLEAAGIPFLRLDGSTADRGAVVSAFQAEEGPPVLLLSLKAGGTGLNLTAADHVFLLDPWWNPAAEDQAADRAHRIGQERPVIVHRLVAEGTVEERILLLQEQKRALADAALGGGAGGSALTRDDLLALLA